MRQVPYSAGLVGLVVFWLAFDAGCSQEQECACDKETWERLKCEDDWDFIQHQLEVTDKDVRAALERRLPTRQAFVNACASAQPGPPAAMLSHLMDWRDKVSVTQGVKLDLIRLFRGACNKNNSEACHNLAVLYQYSSSAADVKKGCELMNRTCKAGHRESCTDTGCALALQRARSGSQ